MVIAVSEDGAVVSHRSSRSHRPAPSSLSEDGSFSSDQSSRTFESGPSSSGLSGIFKALAGITLAAAAIVGIGYEAPAAIDAMNRYSDVITGVAGGATVGLLVGYFKASDQWGSSLSEDLRTVFSCAVGGGILGGLFGAGWHAATSTSEHVTNLFAPQAQDAIAAVAKAANALMKPV